MYIFVGLVISAFVTKEILINRAIWGMAFTAGFISLAFGVDYATRK